MPTPAELHGLVMATPSDEFWLATIVAVLGAAAALYVAFVHLKRKRIIEDLPTALIRSAPQGYVELQGEAALMDGDPIHAPLSLRSCAWYSFKVERRQRDRRGNRSGWTTVEHGISDSLFYLVDATGRCAVDPDGAIVTPAHDNVWYGRERIPGRYHDSDGAWWARALGQLSHPFRYSEKRIEPGDALLAIGEFNTHGGTHSGHDNKAALLERLRELKRDRVALLRAFDADGDGEIDQHEWATARAHAEQAVMTPQRASSGPPSVDVLGRARDDALPFVLAAGTEERLIARFRNVAVALLALGVPLACTALWAVALRLSAT